MHSGADVVIRVICDPLMPPGRWMLIGDPVEFARQIREAIALQLAVALYGPGALCEGMGV